MTETPWPGSCRCRSHQYQVLDAFGPVVSCHCSFCRRVHGAAFTTVAFVARDSIEWTRGEQSVSSYRTPLGNLRHFCGDCASPLFNVGGAGDLAAVVIGSLNDDAQPAPWAHVNTESKATWHRISDDLPEFATWPRAAELQELAARNGCEFVPQQLLIPEPQD